eukprot:TRINITY_DN2483_c0_g1_i7.p1 TRINITY_DN2483_c0_g1~~TRINITY_DN2483_c0_g1_i7.p1  ORF type:complete len:665 (-),score=157.95 TRINITY_DN2483_c0_g1_i7:279-2273(-)
MAPSDRKKRRQSMQFADLAKKNNVMSENELHEYYMNKNYVAPEKIQLETIFEAGGKRGTSSDTGELVAGRHKAKRYIEDYSFWKQNDKERNKRRKSMIQKQFKGRKRIKIHPSKPDREQGLIELIQNAPVVDGIIPTRIPTESEEFLEKTYQKLLEIRRKSYIESNKEVPVPSLHSSSSTTTNSHVPDFANRINSIQQPSSLDSSENQNEPGENLEHPERDSLSEDTNIGEGGAPPPVTCDSSLDTDSVAAESTDEDYSTEASDGRAGDSVEPFDPALILESMKDSKMKAEFLRALEDTDLMFCDEPITLNPEPPKPRRADRQSTRRSVRRSARFMSHQRNLEGSVAVEEDVMLKKSKLKAQKARANAGQNYDDELRGATESVEPPPAENKSNAIEEVIDTDVPTINTQLQPTNVTKPKKRRMRAELELSSDRSKENNSISHKEVKRRKPGLRIETTNLKRDNFKNTAQKQRPKSGDDGREESKQIVNDTVEESASKSPPLAAVSRRSSSLIDISLPDCVRRSLTGEFVPPTAVLISEEVETSGRDSNQHNKSADNSQRKTLSGKKGRKPLESIPVPSINISTSCDTTAAVPLKSPAVIQDSYKHIDTNRLLPPVNSVRKDSFDLSDDEVFFSGSIRLPMSKKKNHILNTCIIPTLSSADSDFG